MEIAAFSYRDDYGGGEGQLFKWCYLFSQAPTPFPLRAIRHRVAFFFFLVARR